LKSLAKKVHARLWHADLEMRCHVFMQNKL
jgi:hypothetical protein